MDLEKSTLDIVDTVRRCYWCDENSLLREYYPIAPEKPIYSYLWGYGALLTTLCSAIDATGELGLIPFTEKCFERLEQYRDDRKDFRVYNSAPKIHNYGEPFYDDNAWVALALIQFYKITNKKEYLEKAMEIAEYLLHGKNPVAGGIYWKENDCTSSNACSSAPTAAALCKLYSLTNQPLYLSEAQEIYAWTKDKLMDKSGIYFDSLGNDGKVCEWQFSYNSGVMIWCGIMLYEITGEEKYLSDALLTKKAAEKFFMIFNETAGKEMLPKMPWFNVYLLQGFVSADKYDKDDIFWKAVECAEYAGNNACTKEGLFLNDWTQKAENLPQPYYSINLDTLGSAECFALLAKWQKVRRNNGKHD